MFAETPWLDTPPGTDGQADLLARLGSIKRAAFEAAWERLRPSAPAPSTAHADPGLPPSMQPAARPGSLEARRFLLGVMNDDAVALALRIEAAKALL